MIAKVYVCEYLILEFITLSKVANWILCMSSPYVLMVILLVWLSPSKTIVVAYTCTMQRMYLLGVKFRKIFNLVPWHFLIVKIWQNSNFEVFSYLNLGVKTLKFPPIYTLLFVHGCLRCTHTLGRTLHVLSLIREIVAVWQWGGWDLCNVN